LLCLLFDIYIVGYICQNTFVPMKFDSLKSIYFCGFIAMLTLTLTNCEHEPFEPTVSPIPNDSSVSDTIISDTISPCYGDTIFFTNDILPIIGANCSMSGCHDANTQSDGVDLSTYDQIIATGKVSPYDPDDSDLYKVLSESDPSERMPLNLPELTDCEKKAIYKWIEQGALNLTKTETIDTTNVPSFLSDIQPIMSANCAVPGCHVANEQNPPLNDYLEIKSQDQRVKIRTSNETMPVGGSLTAAEIQAIADWVNAGSPNN